jgi:hypothetical protein
MQLPILIHRARSSSIPIIAEGKHSYDLEYQLPTEAP